MTLYFTCIQLRCTCIRYSIARNTSYTFGSWCRPLLSWVHSCRSAAVKCRPDSEDVHGRHTENTDGQLACWNLTCSSNQSRIYILRCVSRWSKKIQFYLKLNCCPAALFRMTVFDAFGLPDDDQVWSSAGICKAPRIIALRKSHWSVDSASKCAYMALSEKAHGGRYYVLALLSTGSQQDKVNF